jgi:hypothetical protein
MHTSNIFSAIVGIGIGIGASTFFSNHMHMHMTVGGSHESMQHAHKMLAVNPAKPIPGIQIEVLTDSMDGYNVHAITKNFSFTPEHVGGAVVDNEGHGHVLINGMKVSRLYGEWIQLPKSLFASGKNTITVTLNANDHSELMQGENHIQSSVVIEIYKLKYYFFLGDKPCLRFLFSSCKVRYASHARSSSSGESRSICRCGCTPSVFISFLNAFNTISKALVS